jgi:alkaline phosphatase
MYFKNTYVFIRQQKYPKNVILFIGDGMSLPTVTAARILKGQKYLNVSGEEQYLTWERFPESAFLKTYVTNKQTGDSAATAVAMFTGVKTTYKTLCLRAYL